jgi:hypothetical protein
VPLCGFCAFLWLNPRHWFRNPATRTDQTTKPLVLDPLSQSKWRFPLAIGLMMMPLPLFPLGVSRRAMFTQPPITKVKEMGGLVH